MNSSWRNTQKKKGEMLFMIQHYVLNVNVSDTYSPYKSLLLYNRASPISVGITREVYFSLIWSVKSWSQPACVVLGFLPLGWARTAAAERSEEAHADRRGEKHKHDAVGCSLWRVANALLCHHRRQITTNSQGNFSWNDSNNSKQFPTAIFCGMLNPV